MEYNCLGMLGKENVPNSRWREVKLLHTEMKTIYSSYSEVIAILQFPLDETEYCFDLNSIKSSYLNSTITFGEFLTLNGNNVLTTNTDVPKLVNAKVSYCDAIYGGYNPKPISLKHANDTELDITEKPDLLLTKDNLDYSIFKDYGLVSVNGYMHLSDANEKGIYVDDGTKSLLISGQNNIGIHSFYNLGKITKIPITKEMISRLHPDTPLRNKLCITFEEDLSNKSLMLVIGGYIHIKDSSKFYKLTGNILYVDTLNFPLLDRFYESLNYIDLSSLSFVHKPTLENRQLILDEFNKDELILDYFTLSQSFLVIIDTPNIYADKVSIETTKIPRLSISHTEPKYPLITGSGRLLEYWKTVEEGKWAIKGIDDYHYNRHYHYSNIDSTAKVVSDHCWPFKPKIKSHMYFLEIGKDM